MQSSQIYILVLIFILLVIAFFVHKNKKQKSLTPIAGLAFGFVLAGIIFGDDRLIGYSLIGIGVLLAIADIILGLRKK